MCLALITRENFLGTMICDVFSCKPVPDGWYSYRKSLATFILITTIIQLSEILSLEIHENMKDAQFWRFLLSNRWCEIPDLYAQNWHLLLVCFNTT